MRRLAVIAAFAMIFVATQDAQAQGYGIGGGIHGVGWLGGGDGAATSGLDCEEYDQADHDQAKQDSIDDLRYQVETHARATAFINGKTYLTHWMISIPQPVLHNCDRYICGTTWMYGISYTDGTGHLVYP